ncbi:MAG: hypothetical protein ACREQA_20340 [Candidatus Binatia bacterium]
MYRIYFTQVFEVEEVSRARDTASNLIQSALAGVSAASTEIEYVKKELE